MRNEGEYALEPFRMSIGNMESDSFSVLTYLAIDNIRICYDKSLKLDRF